MKDREPIGGQTHVVERQLTQRFMSYIGGGDSIFMSTQTGIVRSMSSRLASSALHPLEVMERITEERAVNQWEKLYRLMFETQGITGESWIYSPRDYVASLRPHADKMALYYKRLSTTKERDSSVGRIKELSSTVKEDLKRKVDETLMKDDFIDDYPYDQLIKFHGEDPERIEILSDYREGKAKSTALQGMMRSDPTCFYQSGTLLEHLPDQFTSMGFLTGIDTPSQDSLHIVTIAVADKEDETGLLRRQAQSPFGLLSVDGYEDPSVPILDAVTVIDPTILQSFNHNIFLDGIPYQERISFAKEISPGNFSDGGVFIGNFVDYAYLWTMLGLRDPRLHVFPQEI